LSKGPDFRTWEGPQPSALLCRKLPSASAQSQIEDEHKNPRSASTSRLRNPLCAVGGSTPFENWLFRTFGDTAHFAKIEISWHGFETSCGSLGLFHGGGRGVLRFSCRFSPNVQKSLKIPHFAGRKFPHLSGDEGLQLQPVGVEM